MAEAPLPRTKDIFMRQLVNFLNHGFLPFVGREKEMEKIARFWEGTVDGHGLRTALMLRKGKIVISVPYMLDR